MTQMQLPFQVGEAIANKTLYTTFHCACEGGIRYSRALNVLVLVANFTDGRHRAVWWEDGVLFYTGAGKSGDQALDKGMNKRLASCLEARAPVYYFEVHRVGQYVYRGQVVAAGPVQRRRQVGADGQERWALVFLLRLVTGAGGE